MSIHCSGLSCSNKVQSAGQFCSSCDVPDPMPPTHMAESKTDHQLRMELWQAAYKLALGPIKGRTDALETISHLVTVLQHTQHNPEKET